MPISFTCPQCGKRYAVNNEMAGKAAKCGCGNQLVVPSPEAETPADETTSPVAPAEPASLDRGANVRCNLRRWRKKLFAVLGGWFLLADFQVDYFRFFRETGGVAHATFRTGPIEPRAAALDLIAGHRIDITGDTDTDRGTP